jgi:hypothetical protein
LIDRRNQKSFLAEAAWYDSGVNPRRLFWICILTLAFTGLAACSLREKRGLLTPWEYSDLRLLDPVDGDSPTNDIVAVYLREEGEDIQIRLDFLESADFDEFDLYITFDTSPGGINELPISMNSKITWDALVFIPAHGPIEIRDPLGNKRPDSAMLVIRDPILDSLLVDLKLGALKDHLAGISTSRSIKLQVFLTSSGKTVVEEWIEPVRSDTTPPTPAQIILAFWDTFPAYTPATALRRWDGAHTGPDGVRHGLYNLLRTARAFRIPLFLLDASQPSQLSALDYSGGLALIQEMQQEQLLTLPVSQSDPQFSPFKATSGISPFLIASAVNINEKYGINLPTFSYLPRGDQLSLPMQDVIFVRQPFDALDNLDSEEIPGNFYPLIYPLRWQEKLIFPLYDISLSTKPHDSNTKQASIGGLSVEWKRILIDSALDAASDPSTASSSYLNLGGDLPASTWGEPQSARETFRWLRDHPWVQVLDRDRLVSMRNGVKKVYSPPSTKSSKKAIFPSSDELIEALENAPKNALGTAALQAYQALSYPVYPYSPELPALRAEYVGQVWSILEAAKWAEAPTSNVDCNQDPDHDGQPECLLASNHLYAQFEIDDGSLTYLFISTPYPDMKENNSSQVSNFQTRLELYSHIGPSETAWTACTSGIHQFIGPSSQFITGLSDPSQWKVGAGLHSDPAVIPGAFSGPGSGYDAKVINNSIIFSQGFSDVNKTYSLDENGISADIQIANNDAFPLLQIPLALDPWNLFSKDWADQYISSIASHQLIWSIRNGISMRVLASTTIIFSDFQYSRGYFPSPEDPNRDYGPGHYLPFPLGLVEIRGENRINIRIELDPPACRGAEL